MRMARKMEDRDGSGRWAGGQVGSQSYARLNLLGHLVH